MIKNLGKDRERSVNFIICFLHRKGFFNRWEIISIVLEIVRLDLKPRPTQ